MHDHGARHRERGFERLLKRCAVVTIKDAHVGDAEIFKESTRLLREAHHGAS